MNRLPDWHGIARGVLDLLLPPRCVVCDRNAGWLCSACLRQIERIEPPVCPMCGQHTGFPGPCRSCQSMPLHIDGIRAVGYLEGSLRTAIHRFKYSNMRPLAVPLGKLASEYLQQKHLPVKTIVPVPLHSRRLRDRGYNQAELLAEQMGSAMGMRVVADVLLRVRSTIPQVGLGADERRENVEGAFQCADGSLKDQDVLLVDDVCTTGATLDACCAALRESGVRNVWGLVLARERWSESSI